MSIPDTFRNSDSSNKIRPLISLSVIAVVTLLVSACTPSSEVIDTQARSTADLARNVQQIQNLMSRRAFYHSAGRNDLEFELYAKNVADVSWGQNQGFWVGADSIKKHYVTEHTSAMEADLTRMSKLFPELANDPKNLNAGSFVIHSLTTPIIEIAGDGKTAKGVWYTPGAIGLTDAKGKFNGMWLWERYAVDFIKEDGQWKFWHILVLTDFMASMDSGLSAGTPAVAPVGKESQQEQPATAGAAPFDIVTENYKSWAPTTTQAIAPRLPEPYTTFSETFSYGPQQ